MKKIKLIALVAAAMALCALVLAGCSSTTEASSAASASSEATPAEASAPETLVVGFDAAYPPYGYVGDDGEYTGFDLELAAEVADRNGWEFEAMPIDWDAKDALLNQGDVNCIWNGFTMEGREDDYTFSDPYMLNEQVIVVRADSGISTWDDLAEKVVITQIDSAALDVLEDEEGQAELASTFGRLDTISDYNNAFMQLEAGNVDAVACDLSIAAYQMAANPELYIQLSEPLSSEHYAVGFKKGDTDMAKTVTETLIAMNEDGFIQALCEKYAADGITYENWLLS